MPNLVAEMPKRLSKSGFKESGFEVRNTVGAFALICGVMSHALPSPSFVKKSPMASQMPGQEIAHIQFGHDTTLISRR